LWRYQECEILHGYFLKGNSMKSIQDLRLELEQVKQSCDKMIGDTPAANWTQKNQVEFNKGLARAEEIQAEIQTLQKGMQNLVERPTSHDGGDVKVLRNSKDIRAHYGVMSNSARPGEEMRIDDFLRGIAGMKSNAAVHAALSTGTDTAGGFLLPNVVMPGILEALVPASALLSAGAGIVPLLDGAKSFTTVAIDSIPNAQWRLESGNVVGSDATFRAVVAAPKSLAFIFKVSRELLADAQNMAPALNLAIGQSFAKELDRVGLRGSGTAPEPRGILNTPGIQTVSNGTNGAALASYANLLAATQNILQADAPPPVSAIMSPRSLVRLAGLTDTTNQPLMAPKMIESWPMIATSQVPNNLTVGTATDCSEIYVGDFSTVHFMMREQVSIQIAKELFAGTGEVGFICHVRADIAVMYPKALAVVTGVR
jgi:HK97 family phage major capsid protein